MKKVTALFFGFVLVLGASGAWAGGWDAKKGLSKTAFKGELVCIGCSLKKLDGANAQCSLYSQHAIGLKTPDGTMWNIVDNKTGHDIIRAHELLGHKQATVTGYLYPVAHMIEIEKISVAGVSDKQIAKAGWQADQVIAKALTSRKVGEAPVIAHDHAGHGHKH